MTRPAIASGSERRAKTFWEVAAEAGLRTVVVNWWATWPAPPACGRRLERRAVLRLERGGALDAEIAPGETLRLAAREVERDHGARQGAASRSPSRRQREDSTRAVLLRSAELDAIQLALLQSVVTPQTDLAVVYLPGLDIAQHALLGRRAVDASTAPSTLSMRLEALKAYYAALDGCSRRCCNRQRMKSSSSSPSLDALAATRPRVCAMKGGPTVSPDASQPGSSTAVAPTVLYALGVPMGRDLPSAPLVDLFDARFRARYPVRFVETYGVPSAVPQNRAGQPLDQEMIDRLRSWGM